MKQETSLREKFWQILLQRNSTPPFPEVPATLFAIKEGKEVLSCEVYEFLADWVEKHVAEVDKKLLDYLLLTEISLRIFRPPCALILHGEFSLTVAWF